jgi:hypothetical protein
LSKSNLQSKKREEAEKKKEKVGKRVKEELFY